ncbi:MAG: reverse transcriptase-like protein [Bdellovibrionaceae bacterium]|nr:reverse transcriptase-like protein [Pseudobdellovibrionaceae bacterium]
MKTVVIYSDGACSGNPGRGGWGAVLGLPDQQVIELGGGRSETTNNQMELQGLIEGLNYIRDLTFDQVIYYTDSSYVLNGVMKWMKGWAFRGWKTSEGKDVANKEYWQLIQNQLLYFADKKISWNYVRGHTGVAGNERCDEIAVSFSTGRYVPLYEGDNSNYSFDIFKTPLTEPIPDSSFKKKEVNESAYYLSLKNGVLERHKTWVECEQRVKGASGAKFKKVKNQNEEEQVLKGWGYSNK